MRNSAFQSYLFYGAGILLIGGSWFFFQSILIYLSMVVSGALFIYVGRKRSKG